MQIYIDADTLCDGFCRVQAAARSGPTSVICGNVSDEDCPTYVCGEEGEPEENPKYNFYTKGKGV